MTIETMIRMAEGHFANNQPDRFCTKMVLEEFTPEQLCLSGEKDTGVSPATGDGQGKAGR